MHFDPLSIFRKGLIISIQKKKNNEQISILIKRKSWIGELMSQTSRLSKSDAGYFVKFIYSEKATPKILQNLHLTFDWHYIGQK